MQEYIIFFVYSSFLNACVQIHELEKNDRTSTPHFDLT